LVKQKLNYSINFEILYFKETLIKNINTFLQCKRKNAAYNKCHSTTQINNT